jgi:hypothetical protein
MDETKLDGTGEDMAVRCILDGTEKEAQGIQDMRRTAAPTGRSEQIGFKVTPLKRQQLQRVALQRDMQQVEVVELAIDLVEVALLHHGIQPVEVIKQGIKLAEMARRHGIQQVEELELEIRHIRELKELLLRQKTEK